MRSTFALLTVAVVALQLALPVPANAADTIQNRQQAVAGALSGFQQRQQELDQEMGQLLTLLKDFNQATPEQKLAEADAAISAVEAVRRWIQPGSDLRLALEGFIATLNAHGKRIVDGGLEDPLFAVPRAARYQKMAQEATDQLARIDMVHAGLAPLVSQLAKLRMTLAEDLHEGQALVTLDVMRAWVDKVERAYQELLNEIRAIANPRTS